MYRRYHPDGTISGDVVALLEEVVDGEPLLRAAMRGGRRVADFPTLAAARTLAATAMRRLPAALRRLEPMPVPVEISPDIRRLAAEIDRTTQPDSLR